MTSRAAIAVAALSAALFACGDRGGFDMDNPPGWLKRIDRLTPGRDVQPLEVSGNCFRQRFLEPCSGTVLPSRTWMRNAVVKLTVGEEARITFTPVEGSPVTTMVKRTTDAKIPVRKSGGKLVVECTRAQPNEGCELALVVKER